MLSKDKTACLTGHRPKSLPWGYNGKPSGTGSTIRFAKENGCKVRIISPEEYR